jgi:hypothetical protein
MGRRPDLAGIHVGACAWVNGRGACDCKPVAAELPTPLTDAAVQACGEDEASVTYEFAQQLERSRMRLLLVMRLIEAGTVANAQLKTDGPGRMGRDRAHELARDAVAAEREAGLPLSIDPLPT